MQNKLIVLLAAVSALVTLTEATASTVACLPDVVTKTLVAGTDAVCTCSPATAGATVDSSTWKFGGTPVTDGVAGAKYTRAMTAADGTKKITCIATVGGLADDESAAITVKAVEAPKKPTLKCDPAKLEKDKESVCTCTSTNHADATPTKATFSVDGGDDKDGEGTTKTELKVKITKEAKVTCMIYFSDTVKTDASEEFKIEFSGGSGSASLHSALSLVVMMFASIIVSIL